jgi:nicotinamide-nucleotide amidase
MDAIVISVGTELTLGQTVDTNAAWLSQQLAEIGMHVIEHTTIADEMHSIRRGIEHACDRADTVLISGGLGPTEDDLTRQALAAAMGVELQLHQDCAERVRTFFTRRNRRMPDSNLVQAMFPAGSTPLENTCGTAPGIRATCGKASVFVMPGVPREMRTMYERDVKPALAGSAGAGVLLTRTIRCYGAGESDMGDKIRDLMQAGCNPAVGITAQHAIIGIRINARAETREQARLMLDETADEVRRRLGTLVFGQDDDTLELAVGRLLAEQSKTVSTAESCTGGLIAESLTDVPGSSAYFIDGVVTYANEAKIRLLGVPAELITQHGAVSREVADAMATRCRQLSGSDFALSVTGIAGPAGGSADKPVGLVYIGLADAEGCRVSEHRLGDYLTRHEIRDRTRKAALNRLRLRLI